MAIMTWDDEYSVGIQEIDEQHKQIIYFINELYEALTQKNNPDIVKKVLNDLIEYTKIHFAVEETLMRLYGYSDYEPHKEIHNKIIEKVSGYKALFEAGEDNVAMELLLYLKDWLYKHINQVDQGYADALKKAGVKKSWIRKFF